MSVAHNIEEKVRTDDVHISEKVDFSGLLLSPTVLDGLTKSGFKRPSPIQLQAIPLGRCGLDLIVQAKSGTGKTCVFTVIALEGLDLHADALQVLILAPTREIAIQIREVVNSIGSCLPKLKCHSFIGGTSVQQDKISLKHCHVATGTPGRIKQLIELGVMKTQSIRLFVLDEADKLLGGDLTESINWIYSSLPDNKQILALSATYPETLAQHLTRYMRNPTFVRLNITDPALIGIKQYHVIVPDSPLPNKVFEKKTDAVIKILSYVSFEQCLIFSNLQTRAQSLQSELQSRGWPTQCIAGCLDQKDRSKAMEHLKAYKCRILISTDLTSRGIDADKVNMVINLDVPLDHETYLHRIGRAGRFGSHGAAISIVSKGKQEKELWAVERKCKTNIPKLPDPIPSDLATRYVALKLSDVVTTEKIITQPNSLMKPPLSRTDRLQPNTTEMRHQATGDTCVTYRNKEIDDNHFKGGSDGEENCKQNGDGQEDGAVKNCHRNGTSPMSSETNLCNGSSLEFFTACEDRSMEESSSDIHSVGSWADLDGDDDKIRVHFTKAINDGCVAFSRNNGVINSRTVGQQSGSINDSTPLNHSEDDTGGKISSEIHDTSPSGSHELSDNFNEQLNRGGGNVAGISVKDMESLTDRNEASKSGNASNDRFLVLPSLVSCGNTDSYTPAESHRKDISESFEFGLVRSTPEECVIGETGEKSLETQSHMKTVGKPKNHKHPRPFALAAFLKGLSESSAEQKNDDTRDLVESELSSDNGSLGKDKALADSDVNARNGNEGAGEKTEKLEMYPSCVSRKDSIQSIDVASSEPARVSVCDRTDNEVCNALSHTEEFNKAHGKSLSPGMKDFTGSFHNTETQEMSVKYLTSNGSLGLDSQMSSISWSSALKSFSELQKDLEHFSFNPRNLSMENICQTIDKQLPKMRSQSQIRNNAICFKQVDYSKVTKIKRDIREMVEMTRLERIAKPEIVQDFFKKISSKSTTMHNGESCVPQQSVKSKRGKRKKGFGGCSDAQNRQSRGSENPDWRSEKGGERARPEVIRDFDDLLREHLNLKEKNEEKIDSEAKCDNMNLRAVKESKYSDAKDEGNCTETTKALAPTPKISLEMEANGRSLCNNLDSCTGTRFKTCHPLYCAIDSRTNVPTRANIGVTSDQECQMLDQMHQEMLRKRKERKEQAVQLKQIASGSERIVSSENTHEDCNKKPVSFVAATDTAGEDVAESVVSKGEMEIDHGLVQGIRNLDKEQNLTSVDVGPGKECSQKLIIKNNRAKKSAPEESGYDSNLVPPGISVAPSGRSMTNPVQMVHPGSKGGRRVRNPVTKECVQVLKFVVEGLDLSDSEDLDLTLSSCTEISDISADSSMSLRMDRKHEYSDMRKGFTKKRISGTGGERKKNSSKSGTRRASNHGLSLKPDTKNNKNSGSGPGEKCNKNPSKKTSGKISIPVRNIAGRSEKKNQESKAPSKYVNLNLSNNKIKCRDSLSLHDLPGHEYPPTFPPLFPGFYERSSGPKNVEDCNGSDSFLYNGGKVNKNCLPYQQSEGWDSTDSDDEILDAFNFQSSSSSPSSPHSCWPYWYSLYNNFIRGSAWTYHSMDHNFPYYQHQHYYQHTPMGHPSQFCCQCHSYHSMYNPPPSTPYHHYAAPVTTGYTDHLCTQMAAVCQQKYIDHMARVMQKMSSHSLVSKRNGKKTRNES